MKHVYVIVQAFIAFALLTAVVIAWSYRPIAEQYIREQTWRDCASAYSVEYNDPKTNTIVRSPIEDKLRDCLLINGE